MGRIQHIQALEILDSRGNPTIEVEVTLENGLKASASVPSGASTGIREANELRDHDKKRFLGKGVIKAIQGIHKEIAPILKGFEITQQKNIDATLIDLDGTKNKERLGANALLAVSLACAKAAAIYEKKPLYVYLNSTGKYSLPLPMMNIMNGGVHASNNLDIQEFMILPVGANNFQECLRYGVEIFHHLNKILTDKKKSTSVGDEGGFAPNLKNNEEALQMIMDAIHAAGYEPGKDILLGLDVASSELYQDKLYHFENKKLNAKALCDYYANLIANYPIISIEDGMAENDWEGWSQLTAELGNKIQLVGDDLFVTDAATLKKGIENNIANAILIKLNQIGTLTETLNAINLAKEANYNTIISHRSGETEDTFIADLAVATCAGQIKTGSLCRSDRVAKYNQLLRIADQLNTKATFVGKSVFSQFEKEKILEMPH